MTNEKSWETLRRIARDIRARGGDGWLSQAMELERIADEQEDADTERRNAAWEAQEREP